MFRDFHAVLDTVEAGFHGPRLLVIGDLLLDRYLWGTSTTAILKKAFASLPEPSSRHVQ